MLLSYICFQILEQKNLIKSKLVKNDMFMRKYVPNKTHGKIHGAECRDISGTFLRPTSGKFETELAERASHDRETGLKITREVHVFLVFIKIAFNKSLLPYGFWRREIIEAPCTFAVTLGRLEDISKRVLKLAFFLHTVSIGYNPLPTYGRNFVKGNNSFAVFPYDYFNLIVRETLWKILEYWFRLENLIS